jgi:hypothetical protein
MQGDDRVRYCGQCQLNVYNLSDMTRSEAERLINETEGRLCVSYFQRADGTILTRDCPVGLRLARRAVARLTGLAAVACLGLLQLVSAAARTVGLREPIVLRQIEPFSWLQPKAPPPTPMIAGEIAIPPPQVLGRVRVPERKVGTP